MSGPNQFDIPAYGLNSDSRVVPRYLPGMLTANNFVHFRIPYEMEKYAKHYSVVLESLDNSGGTYKSISKLKKSVELPNTHFDWHARIGLVPDTMSLPVFEAHFVRGSTYVVTSDLWKEWTHKGIQRIQMEQHGMIRPPGI
jgi:hypothetical protein